MPPDQDADWDDGTANHAASKDWNSGARQAKGPVVSSLSSEDRRAQNAWARQSGDAIKIRELTEEVESLRYALGWAMSQIDELLRDGSESA